MQSVPRIVSTRRNDRGRGPTGPALGLLLAFALLAPAARADLWYESYERAEQALAEESWAEAIRQINLALEKKAEPASRARTYGMNFIAYFPYLKLGIAYYHLGELEAATQAFDTEERLGEIVASATDLARLREFRERIRQARERDQAEEQRRIAQLVDTNLALATQLEAQGRLEEALGAIDKSLALDPRNGPAGVARKRLLDGIALEQQQRELSERVAGLVQRGRAQLEAGGYQDAATSFSRALNLRADEEVRGLLDTAQAGLRERLESRQQRLDGERRRLAVEDGLRRAAAREAADDLVGALDQLQSVLALAPENARATALRDRLLGAQAEAEGRRARLDALRELLDTAGQLFDEGRFEAALASANRALAVDRESAAARDYVVRAYQAMSERLLGHPPRTAKFTNRPAETLADGHPIEVVRQSRFSLAGNVIHDASVTISVEILQFPVSTTEASLPDETAPSRVREARPLVSQEPLGSGIVVTNFVVPEQLEPGLAAFRVVATDADGRTSTAEHWVLFLRPWYLGPWARGLALGTLGLAALLLLGGRVRRRRAALRRRFNPYIAGQPILEEGHFFGRAQLMDYVLQRIHNNSILIYGERRIGKTSFQHRLKQRLGEVRDPQYDFHAAFIDLQGTPQERLFADMAEDIFRELAPVLDGLEPHESIGDGSYSYHRFVLDIQQVLRKLQQRSGQKKVKLVLLIDEVDELNSYDPKVNQKLRSLFMKSFADSLVSVMSGVAIRTHWEREGSPWFNFFQQIEVTPLKIEDATKLIETPIRGIFGLGHGVTERIIELTGRRPFQIQTLCAALVNRLHDERRRTITLADVEAVHRATES